MAKLDTQSDGDVTLVFFKDAAILDEKNVEALGRNLTEISDSGYKMKMLINFEKIEYLSSAVLGKLVALHKKMKKDKATLKLCCMKPNILEVFKITKLDKLFDIHPDQAKAIKSFKSFKLFGR